MLAPCRRPCPREKRVSADATRRWSEAIAANPWTERVVLMLAAVVPQRAGDGWILRDGAGDALPIVGRFRSGWSLAALAGGHPLWVAGEWDGEAFRPLAAATADGVLVPLGDALATGVAA